MLRSLTALSASKPRTRFLSPLICPPPPSMHQVCLIPDDSPPSPHVPRRRLVARGRRRRAAVDERLEPVHGPQVVPRPGRLRASWANSTGQLFIQNVMKSVFMEFVEPGGQVVGEGLLSQCKPP